MTQTERQSHDQQEAAEKLRKQLRSGGSSLPKGWIGDGEDPEVVDMQNGQLINGDLVNSEHVTLNRLIFNVGPLINSGVNNPSLSPGSSAPIGSLYLQTNGALWKKVDSGNTAWELIRSSYIPPTVSEILGISAQAIPSGVDLLLPWVHISGTPLVDPIVDVQQPRFAEPGIYDITIKISPITELGLGEQYQAKIILPGAFDLPETSAPATVAFPQPSVLLSTNRYFLAGSQGIIKVSVYNASESNITFTFSALIQRIT